MRYEEYLAKRQEAFNRYGDSQTLLCYISVKDLEELQSEAFGGHEGRIGLGDVIFRISDGDVRFYMMEEPAAGPHVVYE